MAWTSVLVLQNVLASAHTQRDAQRVSPQPSRVTQYNNRHCLTQITFSNSESMNDPLITIYYLLCHKVVLPVLLTKLQIILQQNLIFAAAMPPLNQAVSTRK